MDHGKKLRVWFRRIFTVAFDFRLCKVNDNDCPAGLGDWKPFTLFFFHDQIKCGGGVQKDKKKHLCKIKLAK